MNNTADNLEIEGRQIELTDPDKVLYPATGFTKGQVLDYYQRIGQFLLPHLKDRPLTLKRYPDGVESAFFYEKQCPSFRPPWIKTIEVPGSRRSTVDHCVVNDLPSLLWIVNLASLELHTSLSLTENIEQPTMMVFDLDPGRPATLVECLEVAFELKAVFDELGMEIFPKMSGGKGLHIYVPLNTPTDYETTKSFAGAMGQLLEKRMRGLVTTNMRKDQRKGKVFVDWSQNDRHKTTVCVYSLRAGSNPTVSAPVSWNKLAVARKHGCGAKLIVEASQLVKRVEKLGDAFAPVLTLKQTLPDLAGSLRRP